MNISLIVLTYNYPQALKHILESIFIQSIKPYEIIIADDGSKTETLELINNYKKISKINIKHIWQEDKGFRAALIRNKAIENATGDYLIISDGDRVLHPKFIEDFSNNAKKNIVNMGGRTYFTEKYTKYIINKEYNLNDYLKAPYSAFEKNFINKFHIPFLYKFLPIFKNPNKILNGGLIGVYKEDILKINGFDSNYEGWGMEDSDIIIRFINAGIYIKKMKFIAITYHLWHKTQSKKNLKSNIELLNIVIKNKKILPVKGLRA